jgi:hypothetical protein
LHSSPPCAAALIQSPFTCWLKAGSAEPQRSHIITKSLFGMHWSSIKSQWGHKAKGRPRRVRPPAPARPATSPGVSSHRRVRPPAPARPATGPSPSGHRPQRARLLAPARLATGPGASGHSGPSASGHRPQRVRPPAPARPATGPSASGHRPQHVWLPAPARPATSPSASSHWPRRVRPLAWRVRPPAPARPATGPGASGHRPQRVRPPAPCRWRWFLGFVWDYRAPGEGGVSSLCCVRRMLLTTRGGETWSCLCKCKVASCIILPSPQFHCDDFPTVLKASGCSRTLIWFASHLNWLELGPHMPKLDWNPCQRFVPDQVCPEGFIQILNGGGDYLWLCRFPRLQPAHPP